MFGYLFIRVVTQDTINTSITAPIIEGIKAIPARLGPQLPNRLSPNHEPIKPAKILLIYPIAAPRLVIAPAITPINAPTINDQIITLSSFVYSNRDNGLFTYFSLI